MFAHLKIGTRILLMFSAVAIIAVGINGYISYTTGRKALKQESFNKLTAVRELKASQIEGYFQQITDQILTFSENQMIIDAMRAFKATFEIIDTELLIDDAKMEGIDSKVGGYYQNEYIPRLNPNLDRMASVSEYWPQDKNTRILQNLYLASNPHETGSKHLLDAADDRSTYSQMHHRFHPIIRSYLEKFGFYDIFLVDAETGRIVYTVFKEVDYGTSLLTGPYSQTNFAEAFRTARDATDKDFVKLVDFAPYHPSYNAQAAFIASPMYDGERKIGVLIFQMPIDRINDIMTNKHEWVNVGLGYSGETYLVGDDYMLRNQSRFLFEDRENYFKMINEIGVPQTTIDKIQNFNSTIGLQEVQTQGTKAALQGEAGTQIFQGYRGAPVLSSYKPLNLPDVHWVIMSEIDEAEAFDPIYDLRKRILFWLLGLILGIVIVAFVFSNTITQPLRQLTENAGELARGNLDVHIKTDGQDEIGQLAQSFDLMRTSLKGFVGQLEEKVTERTLELEKANECIRSIVENAGDAIITIDPEQNILLFNPAGEKIFGYSADEVLGKPLTMLMPEYVREIHEQHVNTFKGKAANSRAMGSRREIAGQRKDGTIFPAEAGISKMELDGKIFCTTFFRDITERKKAQEQLNLQSAALKAAANGIVITDSKGVIQWVNPAFSDLTGYTFEEAIGQNPRVLKSNRHDQTLYTKMWDTIISGQVWHGEVINKHKDGSLYNEEMTITPVLDDQGEIINFVAIKQNITERKEMEKRLLKSEERLKFALEGSNDGLWDWHVQTGDAYFSPRWQTMLGFEPGEIEQNIRSWEKLVHPEDVPGVTKILNTHLEGRTPFYQAEYRIRSKSGEWIWILARGRVMKRDEHGTPVRCVGTHTDITVRKRMERELEKANERMEGELNIGREIQMSMLPLIFPAFPDYDEFAVYATLHPAREVGGDFYDFYFLDEEHFCFCIGDVSGKGVPAALFMAVTKTLIKSRATDDLSPASILTHVNDELSQDNKACMFVTIFAGILNVKTGEIVYTNAGHNPPYIKQDNGTVERLAKRHGPVVGAMGDMIYKEDSITLADGDLLLMYTDGVTEAMNLSQELFSEKRLVDFLTARNYESAEDVVHTTVETVKLFEGQAEQADDITILALKFLGEPNDNTAHTLEILLKNELTEIDRMNQSFGIFAEKYGISKPIQQKMQLVTDELLHNVISYAYQDQEEHQIIVKVELKGDRLTVIFVDDGIPFNPFSLEAPDTELSIKERQVGGLGVHLVRNVMDKVSYHRRIDKNIVTLVKHLRTETENDSV